MTVTESEPAIDKAELILPRTTKTELVLESVYF